MGNVSVHVENVISDSQFDNFTEESTTYGEVSVFPYLTVLVVASRPCKMHFKYHSIDDKSIWVKVRFCIELSRRIPFSFISSSIFDLFLEIHAVVPCSKVRCFYDKRGQVDVDKLSNCIGGTSAENMQV